VTEAAAGGPVPDDLRAPETSKTVAHALRILRHLGQGPTSVTELGRALHMHRTVAQRLLATLRIDGFVHRLPDGTFALGMALVDLASRVDNPVRRAAQQPMLVLFDAVNETVALTVREGDDAVSADQLVVPGRLVRAEYPPGFRHSLATAAAGIAILAHSDPGTVDRFLAGAPKAMQLQAKLDQVRQAGYAHTTDELGHGAAGIAAPILDRSGYAVASVGIICLMDRFPPLDQVAGPVLRAAHAVTATLASG
jgi:DNA-binding IclR family transcriptional regulator